MNARPVVACELCFAMAVYDDALLADWRITSRSPRTTSDRLGCVVPLWLVAAAVCPKCARDLDSTTSLASALAVFVVSLFVYDPITDGLYGSAWLLRTAIFLAVAAVVAFAVLPRALRAVTSLMRPWTAARRLRRHMSSCGLTAWPPGMTAGQMP